MKLKIVSFHHSSKSPVLEKKTIYESKSSRVVRYCKDKISVFREKLKERDLITGSKEAQYREMRLLE